MEKPSMISFLITLLLAAAVSTQGQEVVRDTNGDAVLAGLPYFIQPVKTASNNGGGLVPAAISVLPFCPLGITQTLLPYQPGLPIVFTLVRDTTIRTNADQLSIEFKSDLWPVCNEFSKLWEVDISKSASKEPAILIGAKAGSRNSQFKIQRAGTNTYKLITSTGSVGAIPGVWLSAPQLVLTNDTAKTLLVRFNKVNDATTDTTSSRVEKLGLRLFPFY